ncbi:cysteine hydrolase family protein [Flagellimonas sp. S174]|uniref:cysteine hydrolase family protein n=1 Tax=Flagellimonas sp. S174 TaxID=3410790 RepID=UPI003BF51B55
MTALLLIDIQKGIQETGYYGEERNNPQAEENCSKILSNFREKGLPIFHVQHCSTNLESPLYPSKETHAFYPGVTPENGEPIIQKNVNSAFIGTDLEQQLQQKGIDKVVITGLTTEHCISTSTRMAANLGFDVTLISDATAAFSKKGIDGEFIGADMIHQIELANLKDEFATIKDTHTLLSEL